MPALMSRMLLALATAFWLATSRPSDALPSAAICAHSAQHKAARCHAHILTTGEAAAGDDALRNAFHPVHAGTRHISPADEPVYQYNPKPRRRRMLHLTGRHALHHHKGHSRALLAASSNTFTGYTPAQLQHVYLGPRFNSSTSLCQPMALVDAYANPNAQSDLDTYRTTFGLGPMTLQQYDQNGNPLTWPGTVKQNNGWTAEQMLDLEMASAICPCCPLIYVAAFSAATDHLYAAVQTAVSVGAKVVSMSWGGDGEPSDSEDDASPFASAPGVVFVASSGDNGYAAGASYPASSKYVVAAGGTSLTLDANNSRVSETVWSDTVSGCSQTIAKPSYQNDSACSKRTVADVAAVADPNTGVAVYYSQSGGKAGWAVVGGTSAASPIIGAMYASGVLGNASYARAAASLYPGGTDHAFLYDVTQGENYNRCSSLNYLCHGEVGYDGPTGNGSPSPSGGSGIAPAPAGSPPAGSPPAGSGTPSPSGGAGGGGGSGSCEDLDPRCATWAEKGYCAVGWYVRRIPVYDVCPKSCGVCSK